MSTMHKVTFAFDWSYDVDANVRRNFPSQWTGVVDEDIAKAASNAGVLVGVKTQTAMEGVAVVAPSKATKELPQLDHDGDGKPGGSTSGGDGDDMKALRQEYQEVVGKKAFAGWDADTLRAKMAEAADQDASDDDADAPPF